ncbi:hypothetical protein DZF84_09170 [Vibrio parahaemolyticus]|nr:hypothetical protein [Vibrio parahaemolyticus]EHR0919019.1 hypothetical protein [Vibrio parahaemolyticus]EIZ1317681.1 hypothetical protein [Vibrio parahaemolyticus]EKN4582909.1 hypothetical protein [Vibrio parahaemolyticus]HAS6487888.1 hypothetical protein [Vibrio parahaemolyticus]
MVLFDSEKKIYQKIEDEKEHLWREIGTITKQLTELSESLSELEKSAPELYKQIVNDSRNISTYRNRAQKRSKEVELIATSIEESKSVIDKTQDEASLAKQTIDTQKSESEEAFLELKQKLEELAQQQTEVERMQDELITFTSQKDSLQESIDKIQTQLTESESSNKRISNLLTGALSQRKNIKEIYEEIFGYVHTDNGEEEVVVGLKEELDTSYTKLKEDLGNFNKELTKASQTQQDTLTEIETNYTESLSNFKNESEAKYYAIVEKINSLLPSALTAGLSGAYIDKIKIEKEELEKHERVFDKSIGALVACSLLPFGFIAGRIFFLGEGFDVVIKDAPMLFSIMLPVYAPILWVAYSSNKSYKLSKRLIEEYTHKEVSSRTFEGLSTQISSIGKDAASEELRTKLLFNLLNVNSENPGKLISDYNNSDHPILDAIDKSSKLTDALGKLGNVPMLSQLLNHLNARERDRLATKAQETEKTLESHLAAKTETEFQKPDKEASETGATEQTKTTA